MRFVQKWSYGCARQLAAGMNESHQKRAVYYYGFYIVLGGLVKGTIMLSIALALGILIPTIVVMATFASLRMFAGGYHMNTYGKCLFVSAALFILSALTAQYTYTQWNPAIIISLVAVTFIVGLYLLLKYAPKDTPNKPITEPEKIKMYKSLSVVYIFVWLGISILLIFFNLKMYVLCLCFAVILELFSITPTGHRAFSLLDAKK